MFPATWEEIKWEVAQIGPSVDKIYRFFVMRYVTKRRPELEVQTLASVNACWGTFPDDGSTEYAFSGFVSELLLVLA